MLEQRGGQVSDLVREHVLLEVSLCRESPVADAAFERSLFGVAPIVDLESTVAGKRLEADLAGRVWPTRSCTGKRKARERRSRNGEQASS